MRCEILENSHQEHRSPRFPRLLELISFITNLFRPLCRPQKSQLLCFQANPASFAKTPGVGVSSRWQNPLEPHGYLGSAVQCVSPHQAAGREVRTKIPWP